MPRWGVCWAQANFVDQLWKTGMLDEAEHHMLEEVVDKQLRRISRLGPKWRRPQGVDVLPLRPPPSPPISFNPESHSPSCTHTTLEASALACGGGHCEYCMLAFASATDCWGLQGHWCFWQLHWHMVGC